MNLYAFNILLTFIKEEDIQEVFRKSIIQLGDQAIKVWENSSYHNNINMYIDRVIDVDFINLLQKTSYDIGKLAQYYIDTKNTKNLNLLIEQNVDIKSLFFQLIEDGDVKSIDLLKEAGFDLNTTIDEGNICGKSALMKAAYIGNIDLVEYLLKNGANVNKSTEGSEKGGITALYLAVQKQNLEIVNLLLSDKKLREINKPLSSTGSTPLHIAAQEGKLKIVEILVGAGADVNIKNHKNRSPLDVALMQKFKKQDVIDFLTSSRDKDQRSPDLVSENIYESAPFKKALSKDNNIKSKTDNQNEKQFK